MSSTLEQLSHAIRHGAALAALSTFGCGGTAVTDAAAAGAGGGGGNGELPASVGGSTGTAGEMPLVDADPPEIVDAGSPLAPYPTSGPSCSGPSYGDGFGYHGQCCASALCYTPDSGTCLPAAEVGRVELRGFPPGSGRCMCGVNLGPFAPNPADPAAPMGTCCYLIGAITCDGRPFLVRDVITFAPVVRRADWARLLS